MVLIYKSQNRTHTDTSEVKDEANKSEEEAAFFSSLQSTFLPTAATIETEQKSEKK